MNTKLIQLAAWMLVLGPGALPCLTAAEPAATVSATDEIGDDGDCGCGEESEPEAKPVSPALLPDKAKPKAAQQVKVSVSTSTTTASGGKSTTVVTQEKIENGAPVESTRTVIEK